MKTLSSTELRARFLAVMDRVNDDHEPVIVHRAKGKPVVMVGLGGWTSRDATTCLLSNPANKAHLVTSLADAKAGHVVVMAMEDLETVAEK